MLVALLSFAVVGTLGYGWTTLNKANNGLNRADVIDPSVTTGASNVTAQNILLVGIDARVDAQGNPIPQDVLDQLHAGSASDGADATDTMIVVHIAAGGGKAIGFSIPRDSYVQLAGGYGMHKINAAYTYAETAAVQQLRAQGVAGPSLWLQAAQAGARNSIATVEQFTGLTINHYAAVDLVGFYDISQAIGGVQVCLNHATSDSYSGANFPAGVQTIQGAQALAFVRQRHDLPMGDLDRIKRQQVFLAALAKAVMSAGTLANPAKLDGLIGAIQKSITLDSGWDLIGFAQQLQGITGDNIQFLTIPIVNITLRTPADGDAVQVDPQQVRTFIQQHLDGAAEPTATPSSSAPRGATNVTVDVYNASGVSGVAASVLISLAADGYRRGAANTVARRNGSIVDYAPGEIGAARAVAAELGGGIGIAVDSAVPSGHVRVYLGHDYRSTPGATPPQTATSAVATSTPPSAAPSVNANGVPCID